MEKKERSAWKFQILSLRGIGGCRIGSKKGGGHTRSMCFDDSSAGQGNLEGAFSFTRKTKKVDYAAIFPSKGGGLGGENLLPGGGLEQGEKEGRRRLVRRLLLSLGGGGHENRAPRN